MGCIYKITNRINGKVYIGQTKQTVDKRFQSHIKCAKKHVNRYLYDAMNHYGYENFYAEQVELCEDELLDEREKFWISYYHSYIGEEQCNGYNMTPGGGGGNTWGTEWKAFFHGEKLRRNRMGDEYVPVTKNLLTELLIDQRMSWNRVVKDFYIPTKHLKNCCNLFGIVYDKNLSVPRKPKPQSFKQNNPAKPTKPKIKRKLQYVEPYISLVEISKYVENFSLDSKNISSRIDVPVYLIDWLCELMYGRNLYNVREEIKKKFLRELEPHGRNFNPNRESDVQLLECLLWVDADKDFICNYFQITPVTLNKKMDYLYSTHKDREVKELIHKKYAEQPVLPEDIIKTNASQTICDYDKYIKTHRKFQIGENNPTYKKIENWGEIVFLFKRGLCLKQVAQTVGLSHPTLSNKIKEQYNMNIEEFKRYAKQQ